MTKRQKMASWTIAFGVLSAVFVGIGSNVWIGFGAFFGIWCMSGVLETLEARDD
jgi:hypothetical protein